MAFFLSQDSWSLATAYTSVVFLLLTAVIRADDPVEIEKGAVRWSTDLEAAQVVSRKTGRPVFLLFQEVPG